MFVSFTILPLRTSAYVDTFESKYLPCNKACGSIILPVLCCRVGRFRAGVPHGWCVKTLADGDVYTGCLADGRRQGFGQYRWFSGDVYTGKVSLSYFQLLICTDMICYEFFALIHSSLAL